MHRGDDSNTATTAEVRVVLTDGVEGAVRLDQVLLEAARAAARQAKHELDEQESDS
jgi:hypothetical protein